MAKNSEVYKTAQERAEAFVKWCYEATSYTGDCNGCHLKIMGHGGPNCRFHWLDLEAEEEKPETIEDVIDDMGKVVEMMRKKESEGATLLDVSVIFDKFLNRIIAAHNRVAKKCSSELLNKAAHAIDQFERTHDGEVSIVTETDTDDDSLVIRIFGGKK